MNIYLESIGCRLNQSEIEKIGEKFRATGHTLVSTAEEADLVVVNTCTVTAKAAADSRKKIRQAYRAGVEEIVATGCWATLEPSAALDLPGVVRVVANVDKDDLVSLLLNLPERDFDLEPIARQPLPGIHKRTRAFIKAQDGCDNYCTFCITRIARGAGRSLPLDQILADLKRAEQGGVREAVLTGVHLASWGSDLNLPQSIKALVEAVLLHTAIPRIRLSSLEPWDINQDFFSLWQNERLCPHLHIPLQSGSERILRRMGRKITPAGYASLLEKCRSVFPEIAFTTDIIVGFPEESEADFEESLNFVNQMAFAGGHVFAYSPRPGTPAVKFPDPVSPAITRQRSARMRAVLSQSARNYQKHFLNRQVSVLWESASPFGGECWLLHGLTGNYLQVTAHSPHQRWNEFSTVNLKGINSDGFYGEITSE